MSSSLGFFASQISGHLYTLTGSYDALATVTVPSGGTTGITFAGIPQGYKHLQIRAIARTTDSSYNQLKVRYNGDTSANYSSHILEGDGSATGAIAYTGATNGVQMWMGLQSGTGQTAGVFGANILDVLDYSNVNKNKTTRSLAGTDGNGSGYVWFSSGLWMSTSAVNSITFTTEGGNNFAQYSSFSLYGVK